MGKLFDVSLVFSSIPELLTKLPITLELAVVSMLIGLGLGLVMAIIKMKKIRVLTQITNLLISLLRGTPVIVQHCPDQPLSISSQCGKNTHRK